MITYLEKILELIGIQNIDNVKLKLFIGYTNLYGEYNTQPENNYIVSIETYENDIEMISYNDSNNIVMSISKNNTYILLFILKRKYHVYLIPISHNYIVDLFDIALGIIDNMKNEYSLTHVFLKDSLNYCIYQTPSKLESLVKNTKDLPLYILYIFRFGKSLLDIHNFILYDSSDNTNDYCAIIHHIANKDIVRNIKIKKTNIYKYLIEASFRLNINKKYTKKVLYDIIEPYFNKPIFEFIDYFIKEHDSELKIFNEIYEDLMKDLGIINMYMKEYCKML